MLRWSFDLKYAIDWSFLQLSKIHPKCVLKAVEGCHFSIRKEKKKNGYHFFIAEEKKINSSKQS